MTDLETAIMIKNMARETVRRMTATARNSVTGMFYRVIKGTAAIFYDDGRRVTRIDANVYPVGSSLSARYEHPEGITLSIADARKLGIPKE